MLAERRLLYAIPAAVSAATAVLAVLCLLSGLETIEKPFPGFFYYSNGAVASMQRHGWEGPAAGLRAGARLVRVDGHPTHDATSIRRALQPRRVGDLVTFEVAMPGHESEVKRVQLRLRLLDTRDVLATFVLPYGIGVAFLLIGTVIFFLKRTYQAALALSMCTLASVFYLTTFDANTAHHFVRLWVSYALIAPVSVHVFSAFPAIRPTVHRWQVLAATYAVTAGLLTYRQIVLHRALQEPVASALASTLYIGCFVADILLLTATGRRDPSEAVRNKAKMIRIGLLVTAAAGVLWSVVVRIYPELITAERAMMLSGLFPLLLAYAVIKKNLFDVEVVLRTTAIYVVATIMVLGLYFGAVFMIGLAMSGWTLRWVGFHANLEAAVVSTTVVALIFHPLRMRVQRLVDRFFFRGGAELRAALERTGDELASMTVDLPALAARLTGRVQQLMGCRFVALLARGEAPGVLQLRAAAGAPPAGVETLAITAESPLPQLLALQQGPFTVARPEEDEPADPALEALRQAEVSAVVPLRAGPTLAGALLLGARAAGNPYGRVDVEALRSLAVPAGLALEHSLLLVEHAERERLAALGKFSAVIIHEIKNPLGIIRVSSGTLKKRFDPSDSGHELASFIEEEVVRMNQTIGQFLRFARPSQPKITRFNLADLVRRTAEAARPELLQAGVSLSLELPDALMVLGDADQVQQVLLNLIINARQALEGRDRPEVRLGARPPEPVGPRLVVLTVADNGPGIDPALGARIFEPFFTTRPGGSGLGLAIARQLLQEQGGRISVKSSEAGTEFRVLLPVG